LRLSNCQALPKTLTIFAIVGLLSESVETDIMATMNVSLPDPMKDWVESRTHDGRFSNGSDYVRHLIRKDQERQAAIEALQSEITAGLASGEARPFDSAAFKARMRENNGTR
jgi:antitoxin ParD1/3/4